MSTSALQAHGGELVDLILPDSTHENMTFKPFPVQCLPKVLQDFVREASMSIGCDPSYIALLALAACAAAIGNSRRIQLAITWTEPCIFWVAIVGDSGTKKSPALDIVLGPIRKLDNERYESWLEQRTEFDNEQLMYERALAEWKKSKDDTAPPEKPQPQPFETRLVNDITLEGLARRLQSQPRGLLSSQDELAAWHGNMGRYSSKKGSGDEAQWLSLFGGRPLQIDRAGDGNCPIRIPNASVSLVGGIQPSVLARCMTGNNVENGMAARFLYCWPPKVAAKFNAPKISVEVLQEYERLIRYLYSLEQPSDPPGYVTIGLSEEARDVFAHFHDQTEENKLSMPGDEASTWSKLVGYAARIALVFHYVERYSNPNPPQIEAIGGETMVNATRIVRWAGNESTRILNLFRNAHAHKEGQQLVDWILKRGGRVTVQDLQRGNRRYRDGAEIARAALDELVQQGQGLWEDREPTDPPGKKYSCFRLADVSPSPLLDSREEPQPPVDAVDKIDAVDKLTPTADENLAEQDQQWEEL